MCAGAHNAELEKQLTEMRAEKEQLREKIAQGSKAPLIAGGSAGALFIGRFDQAIGHTKSAA